MPNPTDVATTRAVKRELTRRPVDSSRLDVYAVHGVVYMRGFVGYLRGHNVDLVQEITTIVRCIRQQPMVRDVIVEVEYQRK